MIRFRFGHRWRRERLEAPADAFALELDGVDLLRGASEERLDEVVPRLLGAVRALWSGAASLTHVPFPEVNVELVLLRRSADAFVSVVSLARPAQLVRDGIRVELDELRDAAVRCGRELLESSRQAGWARRLSAELLRLEGTSLHDPPREPPAAALEVHNGDAAVRIRLRFDDAAGLIHRLGPKQEGALGSLLAPGEASLALDGQEVFAVRTPPFLFALELSRQASELQHALELREARHLFTPGGAGEPLRLDLARRTLSTRGATYPCDPGALCRAMFELGHAVWVRALQLNKAQGRNPYLQELDRRSREGLSRRAAAPRPPGERPRRAPRARSAVEGAPLETRGRLKRLRFDTLWEKQGLGGESAASLALGPRGPTFRSLEMACGLAASGEVLFRRVASHGVAADPGGLCLLADSRRLLCHDGGSEGARWLRDHDALTLGPELWSADGLLLCIGDGRAALAFCAWTGREVWRRAPPRTQRLHLTVHGHRAVLTTDHAELYGVDLADGAVVYKVTSPLPFTGPALPWGRRLVATVGRRERSGVIAVDAHAGAVAFSCGLEAARARALPSGDRLFVAGERKGRGVLFCFNRAGALEWERTLHVGEAPYGLMALGRQVLVCSGTGAATLVDRQGSVVWHLGACGEQVAACEAQRSRGLVLLPGERVRAVEPRGGAVVAELEVGLGLLELKADARLNLYTLHEGGRVRAHHVRSHLAVVEGGA